MNNKQWHNGFLLVALIAGIGFSNVYATTVPFTEEFASSSSNWYNAAGTAPLGHQTTGGPDGSGFAAGTFNFANSTAGNSTVLFRGQDEFGSSGGAFIGNWIADGVTGFSAWVRHNAPTPLTFFTRFSSPFNFPGAVAVNFAPVFPNAWTQITIPIDPSNPQFVTFEGTDFNTVFGNVGHVQLGVSVPEALAGQDATYAFDLDKVTIVPEPASLALLGLGACSMIFRRSKNR